MRNNDLQYSLLSYPTMAGTDVNSEHVVYQILLNMLAIKLNYWLIWICTLACCAPHSKYNPLYALLLFSFFTLKRLRWHNNSIHSINYLWQVTSPHLHIYCLLLFIVSESVHGTGLFLDFDLCIIYHNFYQCSYSVCFSLHIMHWW